MEEQKETTEDGQDLRRLKRTLSILCAGSLVQAVILAALAWQYGRIVYVLGLITRPLELLATR